MNGWMDEDKTHVRWYALRDAGKVGHFAPQAGPGEAAVEADAHGPGGGDDEDGFLLHRVWRFGFDFVGDGILLLGVEKRWSVIMVVSHYGDGGDGFKLFSIWTSSS
jgi:hypothetical protein